MSAQLAYVLPLIPEVAERGLILHVDDDLDMRRSTGLLLRSAGFETREAACGEQALAQVDALRGRLDVLIVDYNLGYGMTGTEVAEDFARLLGHAVPTVILNLGSRMVACRSHQALPRGKRTPARIWLGNLATRALVQRVFGGLEHRRGLELQICN